jgi:hypothetical protein
VKILKITLFVKCSSRYRTLSEDGLPEEQGSYHNHVEEVAAAHPRSRRHSLAEEQGEELHQQQQQHHIYLEDGMGTFRVRFN